MVQKAPTKFFASQKKQFWIILDFFFYILGHLPQS